jgi:AcrR family transcriptional regulator
VNVIDATQVPRRDRRRLKRVEQIVSTALEVVANEGFGALTVTRLADELDLTPGALYRYFESKDELVAALQAHTINQLRQGLTAHRERWAHSLPRDDARGAAIIELLATARHYLDLGREQPQIQRWLSASMSDHRQLVADVAASHVAPAFSELLLSVSKLFEQAVASGALQPGHALERTVIFWSSLQGVTSVAKFQRLAPEKADDWYDTHRLGLGLAQTLLLGWGAEQDVVERAQAWLDTTI